jgi:hypothetical protein
MWKSIKYSVDWSKSKLECFGIKKTRNSVFKRLGLAAEKREAIFLVKALFFNSVITMRAAFKRPEITEGDYFPSRLNYALPTTTSHPLRE